VWDKLVTRERERRLGILFGSVLFIACAYGIIAEHFPTAAKVVILIFGAALLLLLARAVTRAWRNTGPAPTGPLSSDERIKARSKLKTHVHPSVRKPVG
jgi:hypothetical protein